MTLIRILALATVAFAAFVFGPSSAAAGYKNCGDTPTAANFSKILKVSGMTCGFGARIAHRFEEEALYSNSGTQPGDVVRVKHFRCKLESYFDPLGLAYRCRNLKAGKKLKAYHPPETSPRRGGDRCGDPSGYPDYHDLRVKRTACKEAERVVDAWVGAFSNVFDPVTVRGFHCDGSRSGRQFGGVRAFRVDCKDARHKVKWWIVPTH